MTRHRVNTFIATALSGRSDVLDIQEMRIAEGTVTNLSILRLRDEPQRPWRTRPAQLQGVLSGPVVYTVQFRDGNGNKIGIQEGNMFMLAVDYADVGICR